MKIYTSIILFFTFFSFAYSGSDSLTISKNSLGNNYKTNDIGVFAGYQAKGTRIAGAWGLMSEGSFGIIVDKVFWLSGEICGLSTTIKSMDYSKFDSSNFGSAIYMYNQYAGVRLKFIYSTDQIVDYSVNTLFGGGRAGYSNYKSQWFVGYGLGNSSSYFIIEPGTNIEFKILSFLRVDLGISYRIIGGMDLPYFKNSDFGGFSGNISLKFGWFDRLFSILY